MSTPTEKHYLGDGVYASFDGYQIKLETERGYNDVHVIYLEPAVFNALTRYVAGLKKSEV